MHYRNVDNTVSHSPLPARICLIGGVITLIANILFTRLPGLDTLFVHYWVYMVLLGLPLLFFAGALGFAIYQRIHTRLASRITLVVVLSVMAFGAILLYTLCATMSTLGEHPVAYYSSPEGSRRIVVMKSMQDEDGYVYTVYPMKSKYFYLATAGQSQVTNSGIDTVEWESEDVAKVCLLDNEENEVLFTVDFNNPVLNIPGDDVSQEGA